MEYKEGDVINFAWNGNIFQNLILIYNRVKYGLGYKWTHSGIIGEVNGDEIIIYEALGNGFSTFIYERWWLDLKLKEGIIEVLRPKNVKHIEQIQQYIGRPYAWFDIIRIFIGIFGIELKGSAKRLTCSEAVARGLYDISNKNINLAKEYDKPYDLITPMDIHLTNQLERIVII